MKSCWPTPAPSPASRTKRSDRERGAARQNGLRRSPFVLRRAAARGEAKPLDETELLQKWLAAFGCGVSRGALSERVTSAGNHLWHLFSWRLTPCLEGEAARRALEAQSTAPVLRFYGGYWTAGGHSGIAAEPAIVARPSAAAMEADPHGDVYLGAGDFSWTYVRTHESDCGPYFCAPARR